MDRFILNPPPIHRPNPDLSAMQLIAGALLDRPVIVIHANEKDAQRTFDRVKELLQP